MPMFRLIVLLFLGSAFACQGPIDNVEFKDNEDCFRGALLGSRFESFEALKDVVHFEYITEPKKKVIISYKCYGHEVVSILEEGISEKDFADAYRGNIFKKLVFAIKTPYGVLHRHDLTNFFVLSRRMLKYFGEGDVSFFDLAEAMMNNIYNEDLDPNFERDTGEKGYLNTFNHITSQALAAAIFSDKLADFLADVHERKKMPELITGEFTEDQINDLDEGALDNYIDIINNECGQKLGKELKAKYGITRHSEWTPELLSNFLNDIQSYGSWAFQVRIKPFSPEDEKIIRFSDKLNVLLNCPECYNKGINP